MERERRQVDGIRAKKGQIFCFKRAWFDDGTPLGSKVNEECSIDAISQSWSVLTQAAPEGRRNPAMDSLNKYRFKTTTYTITVFQERNIEESWWKMENDQGKGNRLPLKEDGLQHDVEVHILSLRFHY